MIFKQKSVNPISVEYPCTATNSLRVGYDKPEGPKKKFAVCVKGLNFPSQDIIRRLVEWVERILVLEVGKIFLYKFDVHGKVETL